MDYTSFIERRGFSGNPFASTNSETEDRLSEYFVPPPYFESVLGSPQTPRSTIVFAPRGSGKTAQRRMIEEASAAANQGYICATYAEFANLTPRSASLEKHQANICRIVTLAILRHLEAEEARASKISSHQRQVLKYCTERFLSSLNQEEFQAAVQAVKSLGDKATDVWRKYGGVVAAAITVLMKKAGIDDVAVPRELRERASGNASSNNYLYQQLLSIAQSLGFPAVYILVDKVDETPATGGDAGAAFQLIRQLLLDLPTLETPGVAFKFFLWDQTESQFLSAGGRSDRLAISRLHWTVPELAEMLRRRLSTYSSGAVTSFNDLLDPDSRLDAHLLLAYLCNDSPRDMIRMAEQIISEHTRTPGAQDFIADSTTFRGIVEYSRRRMEELYPQYRADLFRLPEPSFTINKLASDVLRVQTQSARSKVQKWTTAGAVEKIGELPNAGNRPLHLYAIRDLRIALATANVGTVPLVLDNYALECPACSEILITAQSRSSCTQCGEGVVVGRVRSLLDICMQDPTSGLSGD